VAAVAILGPGGVGGFLAAALARAGERVVVVAREPTAQRIATHGIDVESARLGTFAARPNATSTLRESPSVLLVTTKATTLASALERVQVEPELTVPLLNGLEHMQMLRDRFGSERVAAGVIRVESDSPKPGLIIQTSPFLRVDMAADDPRPRPSLEPLAQMLERAAIPVQIDSSEARVLWSKLVRLVALACTTSASDRTIGFIRSDPEWRTTLATCVEEAAAVANAEGAAVEPSAVVAELEEAHPGLGSSMQRDIAAGRTPELDAIAGAVLRAGNRHEIGCPTIQRLSLEIAQRAGIPPPEA
jgi:2-dehydropantoate 2-reductase